MAVPSSDKFNIIDYNYRSAINLEGSADRETEGSSLEDGTLQGYSFIRYGNVIPDGDGLVFSADTDIMVPKNVVSSLVIDDNLEYTDSTGSAASGVPESFTLEFDIVLSDSIPKDFRNSENRLFVGAVNAQGYSGGVLLSHQGIALASSPEDEFPTIIGGSRQLLVDRVGGGGFYEEGVNIRIIVNGESGRVEIYAAPSDEAYEEGSDETTASIFYSSAAKSTGTTNGDSLIVHCSGSSASKQLSDHPDVAVEDQTVVFALRSLRLSSTRLVPEDAPVATANGPMFMTVGESVDFDGSLSYDPEGRAITYNWEVELAPKGSTAKFQGVGSDGVPGARHSVADVVAFSDYFEAERPSVQITAIKPTARFNQYVIHLVKGLAGQGFSMSLNETTKELTVTLEIDSLGEIKTTTSDLVSAFSDRLSTGYNIQVSGGIDEDSGVEYDSLFRADLILSSTSGADKLVEGSYQFAGGNGSSLPSPIFISDKEGLYVLTLRVSNGRRMSVVAKVTTISSLTSQLLGHRPNTKYVFKYLSDFWNLVNDKDQIESIWSSMTQVLSNELMATWQNDYAKSLRDISRKYQRRWLNLPTAVSVPEGIGTRLISNDYSKRELSLPHVSSGNNSKTATSSDVWGSSTIGTGLKLVKSTMGIPYVVNVIGEDEILVPSGTALEETLTAHHCEGIHGAVTITEVEEVGLYDPTGFYKLTTDDDSFKKYRVRSERSSGYFHVDPENPDAVSPIYSDVITDKTYPLHKVGSYDVIRAQHTSGTLYASVSDQAVGGNNDLVRIVDLEGDPIERHVDGFAFLWDHLEQASDVFVCTLPYLVIDEGMSIEDHGAKFGDALNIEFIDPYINQTVTKTVTILATKGQAVFVEWWPIISWLNLQAAKYNDSAVYTADSINSMSFKVLSYVRTRVLDRVADLVSMPTLGFNTIVPEYNESVDYTINSGVVTIVDLMLGTLSTEAGSPIITISSGSQRHDEIRDAGFDIVTLYSAGLHAIQIESGADAGTYTIQHINEDTGEMVLDRSLSTTNDSCVFRAPRFCSYNPPNGSLWSEVSYFDNWQTIENNFGLFVGLPKDLIDKYDGTLDYLSVIKSMWFAFLSGPSFDNIKLSIQALFGLPFTEEASQLTYHEPATPESEGVLSLVATSGRLYTYTYPFGAELAINPATGRTIKPFEVVDTSTVGQLNDSQKSQLADSAVAAFVRLVEVVAVDDYLSNPEVVEGAMNRVSKKYLDDSGVEHVIDVPPSMIQKYHTFVVDVPLEVAGSTSVFPLISDFLDEAKPAYTDFILRGSINLKDEISVIDQPTYYPTLLLKDTPHTSPFFATKDGENVFGQSVVEPEKELLIWPETKTKEKYDIDFSPLLDASHFCLSGLYFDHADILAGDSFLILDQASLGTSLGRYTPATGLYEYHPVVEELLKCYSDVAPHGGLAIAVPNTADYEVFMVVDLIHEDLVDILGEPGVQTIGRIRLELREPLDSAVVKLPPGSLAPYNAMNCLFFTPDNFPPPMPVLEYWDDEDVKEKYESGYCEGVLNDYSGDGSWNMRRGQLDMVNTVNSDIDVVRSRLWVQFRHDLSKAGQRSMSFFEEGESVRIIDDSGDPIDSNLWDTSPPVVLHVGYGENPKIPNVVHPGYRGNPTTSARASYLLLGFELTRDGINSVEDSDNYDYEANGLSNYGHEDRLNELQRMIDDFGAVKNICLRGNRSGATANLTDEPRRGYRVFKYEETIWQADKLVENGPASDPTLTITTYFPVDGSGHGAYPLGYAHPDAGGKSITEFRSNSLSFDPDSDDNAKDYQWELQGKPADEWPLPDPEKWMVPSFNTGIYTGWDLGGDDPSVVKVVYGYNHDRRELEFLPEDIDAFQRPVDWESSYLQNVHMGIKVSARKDHHVTHGFTNFRIPSPSIKMVLPSSAGYDLRVCGFYFCNDDPSRVSLPSNNPAEYGDPDSGEGVIGGSWLFFRNSETLEEISDVDWDFETGVNDGLPVLPGQPRNDGSSTYILGGVDQRSDGHVIECHIPDLPSEGFYDIIIRNYRPYKEPGAEWGDPDTWSYHMDEAVVPRAYYYSPGGHGGISWGTDAFGTGGTT